MQYKFKQGEITIVIDKYFEIDIVNGGKTKSYRFGTFPIIEKSKENIKLFWKLMGLTFSLDGSNIEIEKLYQDLMSSKHPEIEKTILFYQNTTSADIVKQQTEKPKKPETNEKFSEVKPIPKPVVEEDDGDLNLGLFD
jgi:hypothetical protein